MISVILPVYNAAATLPACLASLSAQTFPDFEIIIINDGSDDLGATRACLDQAASQEPRLRILHTSHHGIAHALNTGLAAARGRIIARMDADDLCHPRRLELQSRFLDTHPDIGLVSCLARFGGDPCRSRGYLTHLRWANSMCTPRDIRLGIFRESPLPHPTVMFRASVPRFCGGYAQGDFPEDYELWLRWLEAGVTMDKIPQPLVTWNDPPGRLSRTDPRYAPEAFHRIKAGYLARRLAAINPHHPEIIVAGAGRLTRRRAECLLAYGVKITAWLDIDPQKIGTTITGRPVLHLSELPSPQHCFVLPYVANRGATEALATALEQRGFILGRSYLPAA